MHHTTDFTIAQIMKLCALINDDMKPADKRWPPILGLYDSVVVALTYMRQNRVQVELGETYGVSQPTFSRAISVITQLLGRVLKKFVPTADEMDPKKQYIVDGTLLPYWSWADHPELYSGKHKTTGMNVQVGRTLRCTGYCISARRSPPLGIRTAPL